ncbi:hypothetical protein FHG87_011974 [Trinorchestia longiramus]|nr:hypothetical protein FHG87_011974 [Trinorchestia longiramus]
MDTIDRLKQCTMKNSVVNLTLVYLSCLIAGLARAQTEDDGAESMERFKVDGIVERPRNLPMSDADFFAGTRVYTNTGYQAFLK